MKKIAIVINTSWNIYNFRLGLLNALKEEGHEIVCIAPKDEYSQKLKDFGFEYYDVNINNKGTNPIEDMKLTKEFYNIFKKIKPDVILQYTIKPNIYGSIAARLLKIPVISNISGLGTVFLNDNLSSKIAKFLYKVSLKKNTVFFQNSDDQNLFITNKLLKENQTDLVAGSGINTEKFDTDKKIDENKITFLFIARLVRDKGIIEYIEAIKKLKKEENNSNIKFKILGSLYKNNPTAISQEELDSWVKDEIIEYLGHSDNVKEEIEKADCIVLPSYREGLSRVLLEAASLQRPIITTNTPGCRDVVNHNENGFLCEVKDSNDLKNQIVNMINLPYEDRLKMGQKGRELIINEFDEKVVIQKYKNYIDKI